MRFLTAVALATVMLWVPVDGVAQWEAESRALVTKLYEGRSCRRGSETTDAMLERLGSNVPPQMLQDAEALNCRFVYPGLDFEVRAAGPGASLKVNSAEAEGGIYLSYAQYAPVCFQVFDPETFGEAYISLRSAEIFPKKIGDVPRECLR